MTIRLDGQVALITGAGNGLGRTYALLMAKLGAKVVVNDLGSSLAGEASSATPAQSVVEEIRAAGGQAIANMDSVTSPEGADRMVREALDQFGRLDILVCNAGILRDKSLLKMTADDFRAVMDVHMMGAFHCVKAAAPIMMEQEHGRIVLTTSPSGLFGSFGQSNYGAAKMALVGFANTLKLELGRKGVAINCIAPSATTRMTEALIDRETAAAFAPGYVAPMVAYLCSRECRLNGETVVAGANHFAVASIVQGRGVTFSGEPPTLDQIADQLPGIIALEGAGPLGSGPQQSERLLDAHRTARQTRHQPEIPNP